MNAFRIATVYVVVLSMSASAFAGDLRGSVRQAAVEAAPAPMAPSGFTPKVLMSSGAAVMSGGIAAAVVGFMRRGNDRLSPSRPAGRNGMLGAAGVAGTLTGGVMMLLGRRASRLAPSAVAVTESGLAVEQTVTW